MMTGENKNHDCGPRSAAVVFTQACKHTRPTKWSLGALSGHLEQCQRHHSEAV